MAAYVGLGSSDSRPYPAVQHEFRHRVVLRRSSRELEGVLDDPFPANPPTPPSPPPLTPLPRNPGFPNANRPNAPSPQSPPPLPPHPPNRPFPSEVPF
ncbi:unnamed protein product [Closterium sp. NIES-54]